MGYDEAMTGGVFLMIYLDYAATTPAHERVIGAVCRCMRENFMNPSAAYSAAGLAKKAQRMARNAVAELMQADGESVFFTSGGTESNAWAAQLCVGKHAVVSAIEHASVWENVKHAASAVTLVQPDENGVVQPEAVAQALRPDTALLSVQWANNETGVIQPVGEISAIAKKARVPFHVDAVQAFGHIPVDASLCDLMSVSAHKLYGPRGVGALYVKPGVSLPALIRGGSQESSLRAGTENTPAICGFGAAAQLAMADMDQRERDEREQLAFFVETLRIPGLRILGETADRLPGVTALLLPGMESEKVIAQMDLRGVCLSGGAACHAQSHQPSHVYRAMGLSEREAKCVIRVSIGRGITKEALAHAAQALNEVYARESR